MAGLGFVSHTWGPLPLLLKPHGFGARGGQGILNHGSQLLRRRFMLPQVNSGSSALRLKIIRRPSAGQRQDGSATPLSFNERPHESVTAPASASCDETQV